MNRPIAVVGIGCRFPGGIEGTSSYLQFLEQGGDAVVPVPPDRWNLSRHYDADPAAAGKMHAHSGGFLRGSVLDFDADFFGITPREAQTMDPQQRLLLEVAWEALEDAGIPVERLAGGRAGVFVGGFTVDNMLLQFARENREQITSHTATSSSLTMLANRLSYILDLRGPSVTVDTACSSSLVAVHLACRALHDGDAEVAVAGGVNVMLGPQFPIVMSKGKFLAPDGRCKTFDARADGYGRGEGAGIVVLKPLERALADGDRVHAVLLGTGTNQDGRTDGITMPNGGAQEALCREVCERAGVDPREVGLIEAHGTGTRAGDPIEARALGAIYGASSNREGPCPVGSVKASIGHLEAAAGVAGLIKAALAVEHRRIFAQTNLVTPNPEIDFAGLRLRVPLASESWPLPGRAIAAVNSFGYGGSNAHALVAEPPAGAARTSIAAEEREVLLPVSARSPEALRAAAEDLAAALEREGGPSLADAAWTQLARRSHHPWRAAIVARTSAEAARALRAEDAGASARASKREPLVWLFTGMGPQWWGMGQELHAREPVYRAAVERADAIFRRLSGWSLVEQMLRGETGSEMSRNRIAQPANFFLQLGLAALLEAHGIVPDVIVGHSVGEVAAACVAGALSLEDAVRVAFHRSRVQERIAGEGGLLAVALGAADAQQHLSPGVEIAAINSPSSVTLTGAERDLQEISAELDRRQIWNRRVRVEVAYHSSQMDALGPEFESALSDLRPAAPRRPLISTVTGERVDGAIHGAAYWQKNMRAPVLLERAIASAIAGGCRTFLEIGPHPVLATPVSDCLRSAGVSGSAHPSLRRDRPERETFLRAIARLHERGCEVDLSRCAKATVPSGRLVDLPAYPWQRVRHWVEPEVLRDERIGRAGAHPLLSLTRDSGQSWECDLDRSTWEFLEDHRVAGAPVFPATGYVEAALALHRELGGESPAVVEQLRFQRPMVLDGPRRRSLLTRFEAETASFQISGRGPGEDWITYMAGRLPLKARYTAPDPVDLAKLQSGFADELEVETAYAALRARGLDYGPAFRRLRRLWRRGEEVLARIEGLDGGFLLHPALLDCALQSLLAASPIDGASTFVPSSIERVRWFAKPEGEVFAHGAIHEANEKQLCGNVRLIDRSGRVCADVTGLLCRRIAAARGKREVSYYESRWQAAPAAARSPMPAPWRLVGDSAQGQRLALELGKLGSQVACGEPVRDGDHVVYLAPALLDPAQGCIELLRVFHQARERAASFALVTRGAHGLPGDPPVDPSQAALWGLGRVLLTEALGDRGALLDFDPRGEGDVAALARALTADDAEEETAIRGAERSALRIARTSPDRAVQRVRRAVHAAGAPPVRLVKTGSSGLEGIGFSEVAAEQPGAGEVLVEIAVAALNFKDLVKALGVIADSVTEHTYLGDTMGLEGAGRVLAVGAGVDGLAPGDEVFVFGTGTLGTQIRVPAAFCLKTLPGHSLLESACYFAFITAWYSLTRAGQLARGERILIHSAAGGVGLAAVQIARVFGAEIFVTAGTPERRAYLESLGLRHVYDSRTLEFGDRILEATQGRGVDVVLNSLAGSAVEQSLRALAIGGRFVEIGKKDIADDRPLWMHAFNRSLTFAAVDLDRIPLVRPEFFAQAAREVLALFAKGQLQPLPTSVFDAGHVEDAFRTFASGRLIGKAVVDLRMGEPEVLCKPRSAPAIRADLSYLVVGGLSGFGLATAERLAALGARHLVLASRRGEASGSDAAVVDRLRAAGAQVHMRRLDVSDPAAVEELVASIHSSPAPLAGVFHAAMSLDDAPLAEIDAQRFDHGFAAKAAGATHLHRATRSLPLDFFVLYSSVSALLGNPGQATYAAANALLDGLAAHRRALGLPGLSIQWGALGEVGVLARNPAAAAHLQGMGVAALPARKALDALERLLRSDRAVIGAIDIDWEQWMRATPGTPWQRLALLVEGGGRNDGSSERASTALSEIPAGERAAHASAALAETASRILKVPVERIAIDRAFKEYGLDSLVAAEMAAAATVRLQVDVSPMELLSGASLGAIGARIAGRVEARPAFSTSPIAPPPQARALPSPGKFVGRICVEPPYFNLRDVRVRGDEVHAQVVPDSFPEDGGTISIAEAGRHLSILGSCAVHQAAGKPPGRTYYPVRRALLQATPLALTARARLAELSAKCIALDAHGARATGQLRSPSGDLLWTLEVEYHAISENAFARLFAQHARPTFEEAAVEPYAAMAPLELLADSDALVANLGRVMPEMCAGHFRRYPALPVAIMGRYASRLMRAAALRAAGGAGERAHVQRALIVAERFVFAPEAVTFRARPVDAQRGLWRCDVDGEQGHAVAFESELSIHPA